MIVMVVLNNIDHIETIDRALNGKRVAHDDVVIDSWRRCVEKHGLDPLIPRAPEIICAERLKEHQEQSEEISLLARNILRGLFQRVAGHDYVVLLADKSGVVIDHFGDPDLESSLKRSGLAVGAIWSEDRMGTSGIGAVLETKTPLAIHQTDHFNVSHIDLTCTAAPIFNTRGNLSAVLNISRLNAPAAKISQNYALKLVQASVRRIELANLESRTPDEWVVRLSVVPEMVEIAPDAALSVNSAGQIIGATHNAVRFFASSKGANWRSGDSVIGQSLTEFIDMKLEDLPKLAHSQSYEERTLRMPNGATIYGQVSKRLNNAKIQPSSESPSPIQKVLGNGDLAIEALTKRTERLAETDIPILICGETGSGKELLARAIHKVHGADKPFVAINCASLPGEQLDTELFGGKDVSNQYGLIGAASGGTLFLDEISDLPLSSQARLLRVLNDGHVRPVGGCASLNIKFRLLSSTQRDLAKHVNEGEFRQDLYFRIAPAMLNIPPLRYRSDAIQIAQKFLRRITISRPEAWRITPAASAEILRRNWHGNLRELYSALEIATALADRPIIDAEDLPLSAFETEIQSSEQQHDMKSLMEACNWNISRAARRLGVDRSTVYRRMKRYGIDAPVRQHLE